MSKYSERSLTEAQPPRDLEAERAVLGSVLLESSLVSRALDAGLRPDDFYGDANRPIFVAMLATHKGGAAVDAVALAGRLKDARQWDTIGGAATLAEIVQSVPHIHHFDTHVARVLELSAKRQLHRMGMRVASAAVNGEAVAEILADTRATVERIGLGSGHNLLYDAVTTNLADVLPQEVKWLWPGRIPLGKLSLLVGDPGLGKSFLSLDLATRTSIGGPWPDNSSSSAPLGGTVLLSAEDDLGDTVRPRLGTMGADVTKITALQGVRDGNGNVMPFCLDRDRQALEAAIDRTPNCKLVVVDPVSAFMGQTDSHINAAVRGLLAPLSDLAARRGVAIVAITHLTKGQGSSALYRAMGSLAFIAACRAAWLVGKDKDDPERRLFLPVKSNLAASVSGLAFQIRDGMVAWEPDPVSVSADQVLSDQTAAPERRHAMGWLQEILSDGPVPTKQIKAEAKDAGMAWATVRRAADDLGVKSVKHGFGKGSEWRWELPRADAQPDTAHEDAGAFEEPEHLW